MSQTAPRTKFLTYSHDSCGLGHLRRTFLIGQGLAEGVTGSTVLSVVGSTIADHYFKPWSTNHDYLKLPSAIKVGDNQYESRHLAIDYKNLIDLRAGVLDRTLQAFAPDFVIVDKNPRGLGDEMVAALENTRRERPRTRIILGLRDVLDDPKAVRREWNDPAWTGWVDRIYDEVWIWGERDIYDAAQVYGFPDAIRRKTRYMGYLAPQPERDDVEPLRREAGIESPGQRLLLLTAGGGGDALPMFEASLEGLASADCPDIRTLLVAGPLMPEADFARLTQLTRPLEGRVQLRRMVDTFEDWLRASDAVVCMGGYNTLREVAALGKTALVIPRRFPRREQEIRALIFESMGWCELVREGDSAADRVADFCRRLDGGELAPSLTTLPCRGLAALLDRVEGWRSAPACHQAV